MVNYGYYPAPAIADAANLQFRRLANTIACAAETAKNSYPASPNTGEKSTPSTASEKEHPNTIRVLLRTRPPRRLRTGHHAVHRNPFTANKIRSRTLLQVIQSPEQTAWKYLLDKALTDTRPQVSAESVEGGELGDFTRTARLAFPAPPIIPDPCRLSRERPSRQLHVHATTHWWLPPSDCSEQPCRVNEQG